ncbi:YciI family protein [Streptomyces sp. NPDC092369]|uniref:YciI family protein n=1 Tax=Streptomyces sp. NPDC092369 TaxID=3366015 RepID=UPI0037FB8CC1
MGRALSVSEPLYHVNSCLLYGRRSGVIEMYLLLSTYHASLDTMDALLPEHRAYLDQYRAVGVFLLWGRRVPRTGGVIVAHGVDRARIDTIVAEDPFVRANTATYEVIEIQPTGGLPELTTLLNETSR